MSVTLPAVPPGTSAVVLAGSAAPAPTTLLYGPPPISVPFSVMVKSSVPVALGVYVPV